MRLSREKSFKAEQYGRHYHRHSVFCNLNVEDQVESFSKLTVLLKVSNTKSISVSMLSRSDKQKIQSPLNDDCRNSRREGRLRVQCSTLTQVCTAFSVY